MQFFTGTQHLACSVVEIGLLPVFAPKSSFSLWADWCFFGFATRYSEDPVPGCSCNYFWKNSKLQSE